MSFVIIILTLASFLWKTPVSLKTLIQAVIVNLLHKGSTGSNFMPALKSLGGFFHFWTSAEERDPHK